MLRLRVKELAEAQGLNRSQLQIRSGVTLPLLNRYWNNNTTEVKLDALEKIAKALGARAGDLIGEEELSTEMTAETYRETSTEPDTFYIDQIEESTIPVIQEIGGSVEFKPEVIRIDGHKGRYCVILPAGCTYIGQTAGLNPQTVILPGGRRLCVIPRQVEVSLQFLAGDSSDSSRWNGAQRIPDQDGEEDEQ